MPMNKSHIPVIKKDDKTGCCFWECSRCGVVIDDDMANQKCSRYSIIVSIRRKIRRAKRRFYGAIANYYRKKEMRLF